MEVSDELNDSVDKYKEVQGTLTEEDKAKFEKKLWDLACASLPKGTARRDWFSETFRIPTNAADQRSRILNVGESARLLWDRINRGELILTTAARLLVEAKELAIELKEDLALAIGIVLAKYDELPKTRLPDGRIIRKKNVNRMPDLDSIRAKQRKKSNGSFQTAIREMVGEYLGVKLKTVPRIEAEKLYKELEADLAALVDTYNAKISRAVNQSKGVVLKVKRRDVEKSCELLGIEVPGPGDLPDMQRAKRIKHALARKYHPDSKGGDTSTTEAYTAVISAYETLEQYVDQLAGSRN